MAEMFGLQQLAVHRPEDVPWNELPDNFILKLHWHRSDEFIQLLKKFKFQVVTIARHPLDTLISILQFAPKELQTALWLDRLEGDESGIHGLSPSDAKFLSYCEGRRAKALLDVTADWWLDPDVTQIKYEDLVSARDRTLSTLALKLCAPIKMLINQPDQQDRFSMASLRSTSSNGHFWQGLPGLWQRMFTTDDAIRLSLSHSNYIQLFGYSYQRAHCNMDVNRESINAEWNILTG